MKPTQLFVAVTVLGFLAGSSSFATHHHHNDPQSGQNYGNGSSDDSGYNDNSGNDNQGNNSDSSSPTCLDENGNNLPVDNAKAISDKANTANGALSRDHVKGPITKVYANQPGHNHFEIALDNNGNTLEVVYDTAFGQLPTLSEGMMVEACGDFINSYAPERGYAASPDGAIIHWIHRSNSKSHADGFTIINGDLYGQGSG